jgi:hypothetical protein
MKMRMECVCVCCYKMMELKGFRLLRICLMFTRGLNSHRTPLYIRRRSNNNIFWSRLKQETNETKFFC